MKKPFLIMLAAVCMQLHLHAQINGAPVTPGKADAIKTIVAKLQTLSTDRVIEKAYLHFDKPYYNPGDTIYFKAYVAAGEQHQLSKISGILHADLIGKNDSVMHSLILQLVNGQGWGDFALPPYITKGNYRVRAYTQWMQNTGGKYIFEKNIPVTGRSLSKTDLAIKTIDEKADVQFFPEGGHFVNNVPAKIAFKALGSDGLGISIKGVIVDDKDKEITRFRSVHLGMGQFYITAEEGRTYKAKITYPDGSIGEVNLPAPDVKGIALAVNNDKPDKLSVDINVNKPYYIENKDKEISIIIYYGGVVKTVKTILDNQVIGFDLPTRDIKTGIVQVTVFSQEGRPLNERLAFVQNAGNLNLAVNAKPAYTINEKANIVLNAKGSDDKPAAGYFSVAVTDESAVHVDDDTGRTIFTDLLLASELKGYIEQPNYYFDANNADAKANLDILMLTQGYRRFSWDELLNETPPVTAYQPETALKISGVMNTKAGKPVANEKLTLMLAATGESITGVTDAGGRFTFSDLAFTEGTRFLLKTDNASLANKTKITIDKTFNAWPVIASHQPVPKLVDNLPAGNIAEVPQTADNKIKALKQVDVNDKNIYKTVSLAGAGNADQVIKNKDLKNVISLSQALTGIARGVRFDNGSAYLTNSMVFSQGVSKYEPMLIVADGVLGISNIDNFNVREVESVEILKGASASIYGINGGAGVIVINTKRGGDSYETSKEMSPGLLSISPQGFYKAREFYTPRYDMAANVNNLRGTIYWKPNIITDKEGNAAIGYLNNDKPGSYRMVIEGVDSNGNIGRSVYKYKVQ